MKEQIILVGGGGHCKSIIDVIEAKDEYSIAGIVDVEAKLGSNVLGYPIIATDDDISDLCGTYKNFAIAIGHLDSNAKRKDLYSKLKQLGAKLPVVISPFARISKASTIGEGTVVMHGVVINANASLGVCCIVNTSSVIEHDVTMEHHCHLGPNSCLNGGCRIESDVLIGSGAVVLPGLTVGSNSIVAAGAVVIKSIGDNCVYAGNPAVHKKRR